MAGDVHGRGHVWQGCAQQGGICGRGGMLGRGACMQEMATEVGSMHPTGIHSCFSMILHRLTYL